MGRRVRETERKYEAPVEVELTDPAQLFGLDVGSQDEFELDATYFDTEDLRLARAGVTLRRRVGGDDAGWHLELPVDADSRDALRLPLGRAKHKPPARLVALTRVHTRGEALVPVAKLVTQRRRWTLTDGDAEVVELAQDRVHGVALNPVSNEVVWRELAVKLVGDGSPQLLETCEAALREIGVRRSDSPSKLRRVLGDRLPDRADPAPSGTSATAGAAVLAYLREQIAVLRAHDPLVRLDAPDAVHKTRVSARRIRSALQGYRRVLDRSATGELVADLRWLGAELAPARDGEVLAAHIDTALAALPDDEVLGPVAAQVTRRFAREQADGRDRALEALDSDRYLQMQHRLDALVDAPPRTRRAEEQATDELPRAIRKALRRTADHGSAAATADAADRDSALHEMRKAAKRARYVLEAAEPALGKEARKLRKRVKAVQSLLGDHHDTVVARAVLRELGGRAQVDGANGFTFGVLYAEERATARALEARLPSAWSRVQKTAGRS